MKASDEFGTEVRNFVRYGNLLSEPSRKEMVEIIYNFFFEPSFDKEKHLKKSSIAKESDEWKNSLERYLNENINRALFIGNENLSLQITNEFIGWAKKVHLEMIKQSSDIEKEKEKSDKSKEVIEEFLKPPLPYFEGIFNQNGFSSIFPQNLLDDPGRDEYVPEKEDKEHGGVGIDPLCKKVFETKDGYMMARMKRTVAYDKLDYKKGNTDPYIFSIRNKDYKEKYKPGPMDGETSSYHGIFNTKGNVSRIPMPGLSSKVVWTNIKDVVLCIDGADNTYIQCKQNIGKLEYKVMISPLIEHPLGYWNIDIPKGLTATDIKSYSQAKDFLKDAFGHEIFGKEIVPQLVKLLGIEDEKSVCHILSKISSYVGSFSCDEIPKNDETGWVIPSAKSKQGACRHRAVIAYILANYLGIPCRLAASDCHNWPEFWVPLKPEYRKKYGIDGKWFAIDLGGCDPIGPRSPQEEKDLSPPSDSKQNEKEFEVLVDEKKKDTLKKDLLSLIQDLEALYPEDKQVWEYYKQKVNKLIAQIEKADSLKNAKKVKEQMDTLIEKLFEEWAKRLEGKRKKLEQQILKGNMDELMQKINEKYTKIQQLHKNLQPIFKYLRIGIGSDEGIWQNTDWTQLEKYAKILEKEKELEKIAELLGRAQEAEDEYYDEIIKHTEIKDEWKVDSASKSEIIGIHHSDDLSNLLPSEVALLSDETTTTLFSKKFVEKKLLTFQYSGEKRFQKEEEHEETIRKPKEIKKGPIIACLDTSGSMEGQPERIAKALVLALLKIALNEKRNCYLISFSINIETLELSDFNKGIERLINFLTMSFHGGTDASIAIDKTLDLLEGKKYSKADVLIVSDFAMPSLGKDTLERIGKQKDDGGTRFHGLLIGEEIQWGDKDLFNNLWQYKTIDTGFLTSTVKNVQKSSVIKR